MRERKVFALRDSVKNVEIFNVFFFVNIIEKTWIALDGEGKKFIDSINGRFVPAEKNQEQAKVIKIFEKLKMLRDFKESRESTDESLTAPTVAYYHITQKCNLRCPTCFTFSPKRNSVRELNTAQSIEVLSKLKEGGVKEIVFSGGEPFLRNDLPVVLKKAKKFGFYIILLSNGTAISKDTARSAAGFIDEVCVSIDGVNEETNSWTRGKGSFRKSIAGINLLSRYGYKVSLLPTITALNFPLLDDLANLAKSLGIEINYSLFVPIGAGYFNQELKLNRSQLSAFGKWIAKSTRISKDTKNLSKRKAFCGDLSIRYGCGLSEGVELSIDADGAVYPCHLLHYSHFKLGVLPQDNLITILRKRREITHNLCVDSLPGCKACKYRYFCGGGCRANAYVLSGNLSGRDTNCYFYKAFFKESFSSFFQNTSLLKGGD